MDVVGLLTKSGDRVLGQGDRDGIHQQWNKKSNVHVCCSPPIDQGTCIFTNEYYCSASDIF